MVSIFRSFLPCLTALLVPIVIYAADNTDHQERLSKHYRLEKPDGAGPFPSVMMVPGCSGFDAEFQKAYYDSVQNQLVKLGFATLRVDYLAARNVSNCFGVSTDAVGDDVRVAAGYLRQQSFVKKGAINVMAWSYGGAGALMALRLTNHQEPAQVDAVVAYFPYCSGGVQPWYSKVPVLVLVGANDNVAPLSACEIVFARLTKRDKLTVRVYKDAHHCFDNFTLPAEMHYQFGTLGYNKAAAKAAWKEATNFLRR